MPGRIWPFWRQGRDWAWFVAWPRPPTYRPAAALSNHNSRVKSSRAIFFRSLLLQFAADLQSYNRSSYVTDDPLRHTDATGYWSWSDVAKWFANDFGGLLNDFERRHFECHVRQIVLGYDMRWVRI
jgi:hypothetical protein